MSIAAVCVPFTYHHQFHYSSCHRDEDKDGFSAQSNEVEFTNTRKPDYENKETREEEMTVITSVIVISSIVSVKLVTFMVTCSFFY